MRTIDPVLQSVARELGDKLDVQSVVLDTKNLWARLGRKSAGIQTDGDGRDESG